MGTFRARPEWIGNKQRQRDSKPLRDGGETTWRPEPPKKKPVQRPAFGFGEPWQVTTDYERETGRKSDLQNSCGTFIGGRRCGRTLSPANHVCAQCGVDIARKVFAENDRHRDWCAEQITLEEFERGRVHTGQSLSELRRKRAEEREAHAIHVVYYLRVPQGLIKIGTTGFLDRRLREHQSNRDCLLAIEPGDRKVERRRHLELAKWRVYDDTGLKERFADSPDVQARIAAVLAEHGDPATWIAEHIDSAQEAS